MRELQSYLAKQDLTTLDTETTGVHIGAQIIGASFCAEDALAYYVVTAEWLDDKIITHIEVVMALTELLTSLKSKKIVMHNAVFDCRVIKDCYGIQLIDDVFCDTMVAAHLVDEAGPRALKDLGELYLGLQATAEQAEMKASVIANGGKWEEKKGGNKEMYKANSELMARYGAKDALLTYQLFHILLGKLVDDDLTDFFFEKESMPLLRGPTYDLNTVGLKVDVAKLKLLEHEMTHEIGRLKTVLSEELAGYTHHRPDFSITSNQDLAWLLFVHLPHPFRALTDTGRVVAKQLLGKIPYTVAEKRKFINSVIGERKRVESQLASYTTQEMPRIKQLRADATKLRAFIKKNPNCSGEAADLLREVTQELEGLQASIKAMGSQINKLYPEKYIQADKDTLKDLASQVSWVSTLLKLKSEEKLLGTYVLGIQSKVHYGVIRPRFNQTGTPSGRYSSSDPNFQNLPRKDKRIKSCIVARPGKIFVGADYSQLEPRVFSSISKDPRLLECFKSGKDFYSVVGIELFKRYDSSPFKDAPNAFATLYPKERDTVKQICLASAYGTTANKQATVLRGDDGKNLSIDDCQDIIDNYFEDFGDVKKMMISAHEEAKANGRVYNLYGRPRRLPEALKIAKMFPNLKHEDLTYEYRTTLNLAMNFKCQSSAASIVNRAAIAFKSCCVENARTDLRWKDVCVVLQVHDELVAEGPEALQQDILKLLKSCMEQTTVLPGVALIAEPTIAYNLADLKST